MRFALANISSLTACPGRHREERQSSSEFSAVDGAARRGGRGTWSPGLEPALVLWRAPWGQVGSVAIPLLAWGGLWDAPDPPAFWVEDLPAELCKTRGFRDCIGLFLLLFRHTHTLPAAN